MVHDGSNQQLAKTGSLNYLTFSENVFDLTPYVNTDDEVVYKASDRYLHELLKPDLTQEEDKRNRKKFAAEAHARLSAPLYDIMVVMLAVAGVLGGAFSRTGYGQRIAGVVGIALLVRILGFGAQAACNANIGLNVIQYLVPLVPIVIALTTLFRKGRAAASHLGLSPLATVGAT